ncbi:hypothetical protein [Yoonia sp. BS5-3]|uniref:Uncharacterized protein n=1 Tax=Yoonia phaeophyticola TaxID=3137369 RepID=A0ABZ2V1U9_9RHOB
MPAKQDINDFKKRVKSISNPRNNSYYDPDLGMHIPKKVPRSKIKKPKQANDENVIGPFLVSVIIGAFCLAVGQLIRVRYFGLIESSTTSLAIDVIATAWVLLLLTALMQRTTLGPRISQVIGIALMFVVGHNLFWRWPDQMAYIYTPDYANYVQEATQPPSVVVGATIYGF